MKYIVPVLCLLLAAAGTHAQPMAGTGDYSSLSLEAGSFEGFLDGRIERLTGGAHITLLSNDPGVPPLPIRATTMTFRYRDGQTTPSVIVMEGNVDIQHPQGQVKAQRAEWSFDQGTLVFTGSPVMSNETIKDMRGQTMELNFNTGKISVTGISVREMPLQMAGAPGAGAPADPSLFTENDITDLVGLLDTLKTEARTESPSPGKQLLNQLGGNVQGMLLNTPTENLVTQKPLIVAQLNNVLRGRGLYNEAAFAGVALNAQTRELLEQSERSAEEQIRLNRLLLSAAYPNYVRGV